MLSSSGSYATYNDAWYTEHFVEVSQTLMKRGNVVTHLDSNREPRRQKHTEHCLLQAGQLAFVFVAETRSGYDLSNA